MILTNRLFEREKPSREAKSIYIFCEGAKREYQYFNFFKEMDSRINVEIYKLHPHEDNSPIGLLNIAKSCIIKNEDKPNPKYSYLENDEVWIVLDVDKDRENSRKPQIEKVEKFCKQKKDWFIVQSNPCFEVWLYYHYFSKKPIFDNSKICNAWKNLVNSTINGGFDPRRHPIFIQKAIKNSENIFKKNDGIKAIGSTDVFRLSRSIFSLVKLKITKALKELN